MDICAAINAWPKFTSSRISENVIKIKKDNWRRPYTGLVFQDDGKLSDDERITLIPAELAQEAFVEDDTTEPHDRFVYFNTQTGIIYWFDIMEMYSELENVGIDLTSTLPIVLNPRVARERLFYRSHGNK